MSRYEFKVGDVEVVVGWDNPTQTFFGQTEVDGEYIDTMIGMGNIRDIHLLEALIDVAIPIDIRNRLTLDRDNAPLPIHLQRNMNEILITNEITKEISIPPITNEIKIKRHNPWL